MTKTLASSLDVSQLDYCNSILYDIANREINKPQSVQNCLARVVEGSLLRYVNVAVIPGFPDARICGRLPRFGTLVPGARGRSPCGLGTFPALQILRSATADVP